MKILIRSGVLCAGLGLLAACETVQTTSGADYLARYDQPAYAAATTGLDEEIRNIAAIEPDLVFPARIGLARIGYGGLMAVPVDEGQIWIDTFETTDPDAGIGELVPVSPLIAATVSLDHQNHYTPYDVGETLAHIRRGAARQHLDYVLIYEVTGTSESQTNVLSLADATILGFFMFPSRELEVDAVASAVLLDVRNGYPYATLTTFGEKQGLARGSRSRQRRDELIEAAALESVSQLATRFDHTLQELKVRASESLIVQTAAPVPIATE